MHLTCVSCVLVGVLVSWCVCMGVCVCVCVCVCMCVCWCVCVCVCVCVGFVCGVCAISGVRNFVFYSSCSLAKILSQQMRKTSRFKPI